MRFRKASTTDHAKDSFGRVQQAYSDARGSHSVMVADVAEALRRGHDPNQIAYTYSQMILESGVTRETLAAMVALGILDAAERERERA